MSDRLPAIFVVVLLSAAGVAADALLKKASERESPLGSAWFAGGMAVYAASAVGWVYVMRHLKLASVGVIYGVSTLLLLALIGVILFREPIGGMELLGIALAIVAVLLLARFG